MLIRYASSKIIKTASSLQGLVGSWSGGIVKRATTQVNEFGIDPDKCIYIRNRAISALEIHGPNQNWDAFEYDELADRYTTFIGCPVTVDHVNTDRIGDVLDSEFIPAMTVLQDWGIPLLPFEHTLSVVSNMVRANKDFSKKVIGYATTANMFVS